MATTTGRRAGQVASLLDRRALMSLALERRLADRMASGLRRELFDVLTDSQRRTVSLDGGLIRVDLREPRRELAAALRELRRARQRVVIDPDILNGEPVFRGTWVPVHAIASQFAGGETVAGLRAAYPRLTAEMVRLAPLYAAAYPVRAVRVPSPGRARLPCDACALSWHRSMPDEISDRRWYRQLSSLTAEPGRRALLGDHLVDLLGRQPRAIGLFLEKALERAPRPLWPVGRRLRPPIRQQAEPDLVAGPDAEVLQHILAESRLARAVTVNVVIA